MKKVVLLILVLLGTLLIASEFEITSKINENPGHMGIQMLDDSQKYDNNNELCALLIVRCGVENINFSNTASKEAQIDHEGEYWVILKQDASYIVLKKEGFGNFKENFGFKLKRGSVYEMSVDEKEKQTSSMPVMITSNQNGAELFVDDVSQGKTSNKMLTVNMGIGSHNLKLTKDGFATISKEAKISESNNAFNFKLVPAMPAAVTIYTLPEGATVYIDNIKFGVTPKSSFFDAGIYPIRIEKEDYATINDQITITEPETKKTYNLTDIRATITVETNDDATVYFNGKAYKGGLKDLILLPQTISLKVEQEYCETINKTYTLKNGENKIFELFPEDVTAKLTVKTHDNATVIFNGKSYEGGIGKLVLMPQTISLKVEQEYCETINQTYSLKNGENKTFELYPEDISALLTIKTHDNATLKFNGENFKGGVTNHKISPQVLEVEVSMSNAETLSKVITIYPKLNKTIELYPEVKTGSILVTVIPSNAQIEIKGDTGQHYSAIGYEKFIDVPIGNYCISIFANSYNSFTDNFMLHADSLKRYELNLNELTQINKNEISDLTEDEIIDLTEREIIEMVKQLNTSYPNIKDIRNVRLDVARFYSKIEFYHKKNKINGIDIFKITEEFFTLEYRLILKEVELNFANNVDYYHENRKDLYYILQEYVTSNGFDSAKSRYKMIIDSKSQIDNITRMGLDAIKLAPELCDIIEQANKELINSNYKKSIKNIFESVGMAYKNPIPKFYLKNEIISYSKKYHKHISEFELDNRIKYSRLLINRIIGEKDLEYGLKKEILLNVLLDINLIIDDLHVKNYNEIQLGSFTEVINQLKSIDSILLDLSKYDINVNYDKITSYNTCNGEKHAIKSSVDRILKAYVLGISNRIVLYSKNNNSIEIIKECNSFYRSFRKMNKELKLLYNDKEINSAISIIRSAVRDACNKLLVEGQKEGDLNMIENSYELFKSTSKILYIYYLNSKMKYDNKLFEEDVKVIALDCILDMDNFENDEFEKMIFKFMTLY